MNRSSTSKMSRLSAPRLLANRIAAEYLDDGRLFAGDRMPSIRDLAQRFGVAQTSLVQSLGILEQEGRIERRHGVGCFVGDKVKSPVRTANEFLGCIVAASESDVVLRIFDGVEKIGHRHGMNIIMANSDFDYETERRHFQRLVDVGCGAIVIYPVPRTKAQLNSDYLNERLDIPVVLVDMAYPAQKCPQVVFDNFQAGCDMTDLLLEQGHRRILFMQIENKRHPIYYFSNHERLRGHREVMREAGLPVSLIDLDMSVEFDDRAARASKEIRELLAGSDRPTAIIGSDDRWAIIAIRVAQSMGLKVPEELSVVGFDSMLEAASFAPAFPTTRPDFRRAGQVAARLALQIYRGEAVREMMVVQPVPIVGAGRPMQTKTGG